MGTVLDMTDEDIAKRVLADLFNPGQWAAGARAARIQPKTFARMCKGGSIKGSNMALLLQYEPFAEAFRKLKKESEPQIDPRAKAAVARLAVAVGPTVLKALTFELESLADIVGPAKAVELIEQLTQTAREIADSIEESSAGQKELKS